MPSKFVKASFVQLAKSEDCVKNGTTDKIDDHVLLPFDTSVGCEKLACHKIDELCAAKMHCTKYAST